MPAKMPAGFTPQLFISPAEPKPIRAIGQVSSLPERMGSDVLWVTPKGERWGIQRKEVKDFLASVDDGRLAKELGQMGELDQGVFIIEGRTSWSAEHLMLGSWTDVHRHHWHGMTWSIRQRGYWVDYSDSLQHTISMIRWMMDWSMKPRHSGMRGRTGPRAEWGRPTDREWGIHLLTGIDGIGAVVAGQIFDHFGRVPLRWDVTEEELGEVKGLGPKRVESLMRTLREA